MGRKNIWWGKSYGENMYVKKQGLQFVLGTFFLGVHPSMGWKTTGTTETATCELVLCAGFVEIPLLPPVESVHVERKDLGSGKRQHVS